MSIPAHAAYSARFIKPQITKATSLSTSTNVMMIAFLILATIGVMSGMWPAWKAANMEPVEALRYE